MLQCKDCSEWYHLRCEGKLYRYPIFEFSTIVRYRTDNALLHLISLRVMVPVLFGEIDCAPYICLFLICPIMPGLSLLIPYRYMLYPCL
jgi:hypothetical protein